MDAPHLTDHFANGRFWLAVVGDQVFICEEKAVFTRVKGAGVAQFIVVNLADLWNRLPLLIGNKTEFTKADLVTASGTYADAVSGMITNDMIGRGTGKPARFSVLDLFAVCLLGSLKRNGVSHAAMLKVSRFIREGQPMEAASG